MNPKHFDVVIVGAGLSGIGAACHLRAKCPNKTFAILEARDAMGGTWDLFRYPGIRSDSDMFTLGYSFRPWTEAKAIADGPSILAYIRDTASAHGVDEAIRYGHRVLGARWSSDTATWTVEAFDVKGKKTVLFTCSFLFACAGYYDYERGHTPEFPGRERFRGRVVHPQGWTPDIEYEGKRVVVIGSGATAVTLVPELAKKAASVVMLQRSPTYIVSLPAVDAVANWLRARLPAETAYSMARWKNVALAMGMYESSRRFPKQMKRLILRRVERQLRGKVDVGTHFTPRYDPWDQRLCLVPDGDLFRALRRGKASVVTDHVATFTETGLRLRSGAELEADLVVTATGLQLKLIGGTKLEVDGVAVEPPKRFTYRGAMLSDVPNFAMAVGYTNASWTLKCDLTCEYVCRLLQFMDEHGHASAWPRMKDADADGTPLLDLQSGYVQRSLHELPKQGKAAPWRVYQNYALDRMALRAAEIDDGVLEFVGAPERRDGPRATSPAKQAKRLAASVLRTLTDW